MNQTVASEIEQCSDWYLDAKGDPYLLHDFDLTEAFDAASEDLASYLVKYEAKDYTYPGAYHDPTYILRKQEYADHIVACSAAKEAILATQDGLAYHGSDGIKRRQIESDARARYNECVSAPGSPEAPLYASTLKPRHPFIGKLVSFSWQDRQLKYAMSKCDDRGVPNIRTVLLRGLRPLKDADIANYARRIPFQVPQLLGEFMLPTIKMVGRAEPSVPVQALAPISERVSRFRAIASPREMVSKLEATTIYGNILSFGISTWGPDWVLPKEKGGLRHNILWGEEFDPTPPYADGTRWFNRFYLTKEEAVALVAAYQTFWDRVWGPAPAVLAEFAQPGDTLADALARSMVDLVSQGVIPEHMIKSPYLSQLFVPMPLKGLVDDLISPIHAITDTFLRRLNIKPDQIQDLVDSYKESIPASQPSKKLGPIPRKNLAKIRAASSGIAPTVATRNSYLGGYQFVFGDHIERVEAMLEDIGIERIVAAKLRVAKRLEAIAAATRGDIPRIPHWDDRWSAFPHQALCSSMLDQMPERALIDVDMGGGKLPLAFIDAMNSLAKGRCSRPCIVMPTNTVKQQVNDLLHRFGQNVNILAITSATWRKYWDRGSNGMEVIRDTIVNAPPNTLVLVGYEWLKLQPRILDTGTIKKTRTKDAEGKPVMVPVTTKDYWRGRFLVDECGIDLVTLDESHRVKNPDAGMHLGVLDLASANVLRIMSGTLFPNSPIDIVGQMMFLQPSLFGNITDLADRFDIELDTGGKIRSYPRGTIKRIRDELKRSGMVSMRRSYWMHLMPQRHQTVHTVVLPKQLQDMFEDLRDDAITKIEGDPHLMELLAKFDSNSDGENFETSAEAGALLPMLSRLDSFVTCPSVVLDWVEALPSPGSIAEAEERKKYSETMLRIFKTFQRMNPKEYLSPKIKKAAEIVDEHFANSTDLAEQGKVLILMKGVRAAETFCEWIPKFASTVRPDQVVWFRAGREKALNAFKNDPNILVMCAADGALREGHNLQIANMVIRADLHWPPGPMEQGYARAFRPFSKYDDVNIHVIVTDNTSEITKFARLLGKYQHIRRVNSGYDYSDDDLPFIAMNPNNMVKYAKIPTIQEYIDRYALFERFDQKEAEQMAVRLGTAMYPVLSDLKPELPGAARIPGQLPFYEPEDIYLPVTVRKVPQGLVVDSNLRYFPKATANKLGMKPAGAGYSRKMPRNWDAWLGKLTKMGYTVTVVNQVPTIPTEVPVTPRQARWRTLVTADYRAQQFMLNRCPHIRESGATYLYEVKYGNDRLGTFYLSEVVSGAIGGLPPKVWRKIARKYIEPGFGELDLDWQPPARKPRKTPTTKNIEVLGFEVYDETFWLTIDVTEATKKYTDALTAVGFVQHSAFFQRDFRTSAGLRNAARALRRAGVKPTGIKRAMKDYTGGYSRFTDMLSYPQIPGTVRAYYVSNDFTNVLAVSAPEHPEDLEAVEGARKFSQVGPKFWVECPDYRTLKNLLSKLARRHFRVSNWGAFVDEAADWFGFEPTVDMTGEALVSPVITDETKASTITPSKTSIPTARRGRKSKAVKSLASLDWSEFTNMGGGGATSAKVLADDPGHIFLVPIKPLAKPEDSEWAEIWESGYVSSLSWAVHQALASKFGISEYEVVSVHDTGGVIITKSKAPEPEEPAIPTIAA